MSTPDAIESLTSMSAQHVTGKSTEDDEGVLVFWLEDGEDAVEIRHEVGSRVDAARALLRLADAVRAHVERIAPGASTHPQPWLHGPLTGPVPWPRP